MLSRLVFIVQPHLYKLNMTETVTEANLTQILDKIVQYKIKTKLERPHKA